MSRPAPPLFWYLFPTWRSFSITCANCGLIVATEVWREQQNELLNPEFLMTNISQSHRSGRDSSSV